MRLGLGMEGRDSRVQWEKGWVGEAADYTDMEGNIDTGYCTSYSWKNNGES